MRRSVVRERGLPLQLLVISDITQPLREEELHAVAAAGARAGA